MKIPTKAELKKANVTVLERMKDAKWSKRLSSSVGLGASDFAETEWNEEGLIALKLLRRILVTSKGNPITTAEFAAFLGIISDRSLQYLDDPNAVLDNPII